LTAQTASFAAFQTLRLGKEDEGVSTCKNLHADNLGLQPLSIGVERLISSLEGQDRLPSFSISYSEPSVPPIPARRGPPKAKRQAWWKKSKYLRKRCDNRLKPPQVNGMFEADSFARTIGLPLTAFLSVNWGLTAHGSEDVQKGFQRALKAMGEWFRRRGVPATWIYSHENPEGARPHFHMLLHLPEPLRREFEAACQKWFQPLAGGFHLRWRNGAADRCLMYMCKGTDIGTATRHGGRARRQGPVVFKRAGWSENLGQKARTAFQIASKAPLATGFRK
jgi:hypothetical protein